MRETCARNKRSCDQFLITNRYYNSGIFVSNRDIAMLPVKAQYLLKSQIEKFDHFKRNIKNCALKSYVWQPDDLCLRRKKCYKSIGDSGNQKSLKSPLTYFKKFSKIDCPCYGLHFYECETTVQLQKKRAILFDYTISPNQWLSDDVPSCIHLFEFI